MTKQKPLLFPSVPNTPAYLRRLPTKAEVPADLIVVHNSVRGKPRLGLNGFRAWLARPAARYIRCDCSPDGAIGQEAFAVIRDTIAKLNMVAVGRVVLARREHVIALEPKGRGLVGTTLRYPYEVRDEKPYFEDIPELKLPNSEASTKALDEVPKAFFSRCHHSQVCPSGDREWPDHSLRA
jgi:hypothetical protein